MPHFEENQIAGNGYQNERGDQQVNVYAFHNLGSPLILVNIIKNKRYNAADYGSKKIRVDDGQFHCNYPSPANLSENKKNTTAIVRATPDVMAEKRTLRDGINSGEIAPAENQATEMFPEISEIRSNWPMDNLIAKESLT